MGLGEHFKITGDGKQKLALLGLEPEALFQNARFYSCVLGLDDGTI